METEENLQDQIDELLSKNLYLESYSRRENIKFFSIPEEEGENTEDILREFMERELGYRDARSVEFQRVHRINRGRNVHGPRPIIARFLGQIPRPDSPASRAPDIKCSAISLKKSLNAEENRCQH